MEIQRTITIFLPDDADVRATLAVFRSVQNAVSEVAFNGGKPLRAVELQRVVYEQVKGTLSSQMTITALRLVAGAYASAKRNYARRIRAEARRKARCEAKGWTTRHATLSQWASAALSAQRRCSWSVNAGVTRTSAPTARSPFGRWRGASTSPTRSLARCVRCSTPPKRSTR